MLTLEEYLEMISAYKLEEYSSICTKASWYKSNVGPIL